jgi:hypothetical protein
LRRLQGRRQGRFCGHPGGFRHHINGVFADDIMAAATVPAVWRGFVQKGAPKSICAYAVRKAGIHAGIGPGVLLRNARCLPDIFA